jgi:hypothetical protein
MLPPPVQRAESLLADVVSILYAAFRANNDSEDYIRSLVLLKIRERLDELRALKNSANRVDPVQRGARPTRRLRLPPVGANLLPPSAEGIIHRMLGFADERLGRSLLRTSSRRGRTARTSPRGAREAERALEALGGNLVTSDSKTAIGYGPLWRDRQRRRLSQVRTGDERGG